MTLSEKLEKILDYAYMQWTWTDGERPKEDGETDLNNPETRENAIDFLRDFVQGFDGTETGNAGYIYGLALECLDELKKGVLQEDFRNTLYKAQNTALCVSELLERIESENTGYNWGTVCSLSHIVSELNDLLPLVKSTAAAAGVEVET